MTLVIVRIILRYLAAILVTRGLMSQDVSDIFSTDPDFADGLDLLLGSIIAAAVEGWYYLTHRFGWRK